MCVVSEGGIFGCVGLLRDKRSELALLWLDPLGYSPGLAYPM